MFRPIIAAMAPSLLALAACDDAGGGNVTSITGPKENIYQKRLLALNEVDRSLALRRAIQDDGGQCPRIEASAYQQDYKGMAMWTARCSNRDWSVYVAPSGTVQARACSDARQTGLPECRTPPD